MIECDGEKATSIDVVKGVRLWYLPGLSEMTIDIRPNARDKILGMDIGRTEEVRNFLNGVGNKYHDHES